MSTSIRKTRKDGLRKEYVVMEGLISTVPTEMGDDEEGAS